MRHTRKRNVVLVVMLLAIVALATSGYLWYDSQSEAFAAKEYYSRAREAVTSPSLAEQTDAAAPEWAAAEDNYIAWLYSPDTLIDYPVVRARDYNEYIYKLPDGTPSGYGSLFLEPLCSPDFTDRLNIIYGHNMYSDEMFGSLGRYKNQSYYDSHPVMYLYTPTANYRVDLHYGCVINTGTWTGEGFILQENTDELLKYVSNRTTFSSGHDITPDERILVLSTCSVESIESRYVLIGTLEKIGIEQHG